MGNTQPSNVLLPSIQYPTRPFEASSQNKTKLRSCLTKGIIPAIPDASIATNTKRNNNNNNGVSSKAKKKRAATVLHQLILLQDWQRVLIRAKLYPFELHQYSSFQIISSSSVIAADSGTNPKSTTATNFPPGGTAMVRVLPLHLVCALDPPLAVIELLLELYIDACSLPIEPHMNTTSSMTKFLLLDRSNKNSTQHNRAGDYNSDVVASTISSPRPLINPRWKNLSNAKTKKTLGRRFTEWRNHRMGAFPSVDVTTTISFDEAHCFLSKSVADDDDDPCTGGRRANNYNWYDPNDEQVLFYEKRKKFVTKDVIKPGDDRNEIKDNSLLDHEDSLEWDDNQYDEPSWAISTRLSLDDSYDDDDRSEKSVILQLSPSGGLHPLPVVLQKSDDTGSTSYCSSSSNKSSSMRNENLFRVRWDYGPLYEQIVQNGILLPIHIACFYSASPKVIKALVNAYPIACLMSVNGMLPIHWVAAGWNVPPLFPPPSSMFSNTSTSTKNNHTLSTMPLLNNLLDNVRKVIVSETNDKETNGPFEILRVLTATMPESVKVKSGNHGMTAEDYITECMEDCVYKEDCLRLLNNNTSNRRKSEEDSIVERKVGVGRRKDCKQRERFVSNDNDDISFSTLESLIFSRSDTSSSFCFSEQPILFKKTSTTMKNDKSYCTSKNNVNDGSSNRCTSLKTTGLYCMSSLMLHRDWDGIVTAVEHDPFIASKWIYGMDENVSPSRSSKSNSADEGISGGSAVVWKRLPIHLACVFGAPLDVIMCLLQSYPSGVSSIDPHDGSLPLHIACRFCCHEYISSSLSVATVKVLLSVYPEGATVVDLKGRFPLHIAVISSAPYEVIEALIQVEQQCVTMPDQFGKTPKDYASIEPHGSNNGGKHHNNRVTDLLAMVHLLQNDERSV